MSMPSCRIFRKVWDLELWLTNAQTVLMTCEIQIITNVFSSEVCMETIAVCTKTERKGQCVGGNVLLIWELQCIKSSDKDISDVRTASKRLIKTVIILLFIKHLKNFNHSYSCSYCNCCHCHSIMPRHIIFYIFKEGFWTSLKCKDNSEALTSIWLVAHCLTFQN